MSQAPSTEMPVSLIRSQLAALADRLDISFDNGKNNAEAIKAWQKLMPSTPQKTAAILLVKMPEDTRLWIEFPVKEPKTFAVYLTRFDEKATTEARNVHPCTNAIGDNQITGRKMRMIRAFDLDKKTVSGGGVRIFNSQERNQGMTLQPLENFLKFSVISGMKKMSINAGETGTYTWAKYGFVPDPDAWGKLKEKLSIRFRLLQEDPDHWTKIPVSVSDKMDKALKSDDPKMIWQIADMDTDIDGLSLGKRLLLPGFEKLLPAYSHALAKEDRDLDWKGFILFNDTEQMHRLNSYLSVKKGEKVGVLAHHIEENHVPKKDKPATLNA